MVLSLRKQTLAEAEPMEKRGKRRRIGSRLRFGTYLMEAQRGVRLRCQQGVLTGQGGSPVVENPAGSPARAPGPEHFLAPAPQRPPPASLLCPVGEEGFPFSGSVKNAAPETPPAARVTNIYHWYIQ